MLAIQNRALKMLFTVVCLIGLGCSSKKEESKAAIPINIEYLKKKNTYTAGDSISLFFSANRLDLPYKLQLKNAFGTVVISKKEQKGQLVYSVPHNFTRKSGICQWKLVHKGEILDNGNLYIKSNTAKETRLETYFGPRSITAGLQDYSMLVLAPTDIYDNMLDYGTEMLIKSQFLENIQAQKVATKNLVAWHRIPSKTKSGKILVTAICNGTSTKEHTTIVFPALATDFKISANANHDFADGNQIIELETDIIKDAFGNKISDGTLVNFRIKDSKNTQLFTIGTTINGIAKAKILHPSEASQWKITAYITGASKSNSIAMNFKAAVKDFETSFSNGNRTITIKPLKSFMDQIVPDGILVQLDIYASNGTHLETKKTSTKKGVSSFYIRPEYFPNGRYRLVIKAAGITKEIQKELHEI